MESPKTYRGYNSEGTCVVTRTGADANNQINPADVQTAIDNVKNVFEEQMQSIARSLNNLSQDAEEAIIVQGTNMGGTIEDTAQLIAGLAEQVTSGIDQLYSKAVEVHDQLQRNNNTEAYNSCYSASGVTHVS